MGGGWLGGRGVKVILAISNQKQVCFYMASLTCSMAVIDRLTRLWPGWVKLEFVCNRCYHIHDGHPGKTEVLFL